MNAQPSILLDRPALPDWPRLMRETMAAAYVGISGSMLREHGPAPKKLGRCALWDRNDLDRWADALSGQPLDEPERRAEADDAHRRIMERIANGAR